MTFKSFCFSALLLIFPTISFAHSGGTDGNGCHAGTKPYHCHNGSDASSSLSGTDVAVVVGATFLAVGAIWYFSQCDDEEEWYSLGYQEGSSRGWSPTIEISGSESAQTTSFGLQYRF